MSDLSIWRLRAQGFEEEVSGLLGSYDEAVRSRVFNAHEALRRVSELSFDQADSLKQSVRCVETGLFQAAFVMAWTAIADLILEVSVARAADVSLVRPAWSYTDKTSLSESFGDYIIIEALKASKVITKSQMKTLHGLLHRRNQCAHRSDIFPTANEALGYIDEVILSAKEMIKILS